MKEEEKPRYQSLCVKHGFLNESSTPEGAWASIYHHEEKTGCNSHCFLKVVTWNSFLRDLLDED